MQPGAVYISLPEPKGRDENPPSLQSLIPFGRVSLHFKTHWAGKNQICYLGVIARQTEELQGGEA